jgi:hypothetical protein
VVAAPFPGDMDDVPVIVDASTGGRVRFPVLIPGATYRLRVTAQDKPYREVVYEREFQVEAGKTLKLADVVLPRGK